MCSSWEFEGDTIIAYQLRKRIRLLNVLNLLSKRLRDCEVDQIMRWLLEILDLWLSPSVDAEGINIRVFKFKEERFPANSDASISFGNETRERSLLENVHLSVEVLSIRLNSFTTNGVEIIACHTDKELPLSSRVRSHLYDV